MKLDEPLFVYKCGDIVKYTIYSLENIFFLKIPILIFFSILRATWICIFLCENICTFIFIPVFIIVYVLFLLFAFTELGLGQRFAQNRSII